jgi:hypothetical protein
VRFEREAKVIAALRHPNYEHSYDMADILIVPRETQSLTRWSSNSCKLLPDKISLGTVAPL